MIFKAVGLKPHTPLLPGGGSDGVVVHGQPAEEAD